MASKKFKRRKKRFILPFEYSENKKPEAYKTISNIIQISETDRISYIFQIDKENNVLEVINVSQEVQIDDGWMTVLRYDSEHGYLHRHTKLTPTNTNGISTTIGVKKKGDQKKWLTWAIDDIKKRYGDYKKGFIKRNNLMIQNDAIDNES